MKKPISLPQVVLIAILVLLVAFYLRAVVAKEHPLRAACMVNAKKWTLGQVLYKSDYDMAFPLGDKWQNLVTPYLVSTRADQLFCPFIKDRNLDQFGYSMYFKMASRKVDSIPDPEITVLIFESVVLDKNAATGLVGFSDRHEPVPFGFADGHAKGYDENNKTERDKIIAANIAIK